MPANPTPTRSVIPDTTPSATSSHSDLETLHETVLDSFHIRRQGGVVVSCGDTYMLAVEFDGSYGNGGVCGEMVYVDKNPAAQKVVRGRRCARASELGTNFLMGETVEYIEATNETAFFSLLSKYKRGCSTQGNIDIKSGLKLYETNISK